MDTYENKDTAEQPIPTEPAAEPVVEETVEAAAEVVSEPVAETQAETYHIPSDEEEPPVSTEPDEAPVAKKKAPGKILKSLLALLLVAALVATGCGVTAFIMSRHWSNRELQLTLQADSLKDTIKELEASMQELQEFVNDNSFTGNGNSISGTPNGTADGSLTPAQVYAKCRKSVVSVAALITVDNYGQVSSGYSYGSGFLISENGYLITNHHVVEGASQVVITLYDKSEHAATIIGYDANNDIAVLKIEGNGYHAATIGSSDDLIVGDQVVAIGYPLTDAIDSLTVGYISAKNRKFSVDGVTINMLQTDTALNSGNSGGPMFNMKGEVIGITTAKYASTSSSGVLVEGVAFAVPIDDVIRKVNDLMNHGFITGAYLGIYVREMDPSLSAYGLPIGAYVEEVTEGNCAHKAGLQAQDIIIALGEYTVDGLNALSRALDHFKAGDTTTITVWRSGAQLELDVTLDEKPH